MSNANDVHFFFLFRLEICLETQKPDRALGLGTRAVGPNPGTSLINGLKIWHLRSLVLHH